MNTGQTMLTIAALAMLSVITMRYYGSIANSGDSLAQSNEGLTATTIATSYIERAQNTAFDAKTVGDSSALHGHYSYLTTWDHMGPEAAHPFEATCIDSMDDFDDFNGFVQDYYPGWMSEHYKVAFQVYYVEPTDISVPVHHQTYVKRMDLKVWRVGTNVGDSIAARQDTAHMSTISGFFRYNMN